MFGHVAWLADSEHAYAYLLYLLFAVELNDIAAYLSGKLPSFDRYQMPKDRSTMEQVWRAVTFAKDDPIPVLEPSPMILDMLWGHRYERFAEFGWAAARFDDLLGWVPARIRSVPRTP